MVKDKLLTVSPRHFEFSVIIFVIVLTFDNTLKISTFRDLGTVVQLYSCTVVQLYSCRVVQLYSCTVCRIYKLCRQNWTVLLLVYLWLKHCDPSPTFHINILVSLKSRNLIQQIEKFLPFLVLLSMIRWGSMNKGN